MLRRTRRAFDEARQLATLGIGSAQTAASSLEPAAGWERSIVTVGSSFAFPRPDIDYGAWFGGAQHVRALFCDGGAFQVDFAEGRHGDEVRDGFIINTSAALQFQPLETGQRFELLQPFLGDAEGAYFSQLRAFDPHRRGYAREAQFAQVLESENGLESGVGHGDTPDVLVVALAAAQIEVGQIRHLAERLHAGVAQ